VVSALENPGSDPTFLEFFGFKEPPFARLSRASQIFHTEQYSLLMSHLATATEQPDCLIVICGTDGSGKTTLLNRFIASLGEDVSFATIDETCNGEKQFYCAFLRQLGFKDITGTPRELRRITKEFLVHRGMAGDPFLMVIDNAHLINPKVLEQLRWISAIKVKDRRVLSVVLAGSSDLERVMDSPAMSQMKFRSHVLFNIRVYTEEETTNYVRHHLKLAAGKEVVNFSNEAYPLIHRYTGGVPNLINMLCTDALTEALALETRDITEDLVRSVADNRRLLPHVVPLQGKGRRRSDPDFKLVQPDRQTGERITARDSKTIEPVGKSTSKHELPEVDGNNLLAQFSQLSEQVGELSADRMRALQDVGTRDKDIGELRNKLETQIAETEKLVSALADNTDEIARLKQALSDSKKALSHSEKALSDNKKALSDSEKALSDSEKALQKSEKSVGNLTTDLEKERIAVKAVQTDFAKAKATADGLSQLKSELQAAVSGLTADLKLADERVVDIDVLEKSTTALKDEIQKKAGELDSRGEALGDLEQQLQESQNECASLRPKVASVKKLEESVSEKDARIANLIAELASHSQEIKALEAKNVELECPDKDLAQAERTAALESELQEVRKTLKATQRQLEENPESTAQPKTEVRKTPKTKARKSSKTKARKSTKTKARRSPGPERQVAAPSNATEKDATAVHPGTAITALEVVKDGKIQNVMEVAGGQSRIMIGRSEDSDLHLNSEFVSRHHALIFCAEQGLYIEDLNSSNGTLVNSKTVTRCDLQIGDIVTIGDFQIKPR